MALAESRLCPTCRARLPEFNETTLLLNFRDCCAQAPNFITPKLSILETIFRSFFSNGNQPLSIGEISQKLKEYRKDFNLTPEKLERMLQAERYYGLRPIPTEEQSTKISPQS